MRNRNTVEFLAVWEELHNPDFNRVQFEAVRSEAGLNRFVMTPTKWIEQTNAIGIVSKAGRYGGGTYAHSDIAMAFATWISPEFQLYIMKDYRRLKQDENSRFSLDWNLNRALSKVNYRIHTDAVKENLIPPELTPEQIAYTYASEADLLNVALFGQTAKQWKNNNPSKKGNVRDDANLNQLLVLANMESYNARGKNNVNKFENEVAFARNYLVMAGYIDNSVHGVWTLTEAGNVVEITDDMASDIFKSGIIKMQSKRDKKGTAIADDDVDTVHYWIYAPGENSCMWENFYAEGIMAIGWGQIGDLKAFDSKDAMKTKMKEILGTSLSYKNAAHTTWQFANNMKVGDVVFVKKGRYQLVGRGIVTSDYEYDGERDDEYGNIRKVNWTHKGEWPHPGQAAMKTLTDITAYGDYVEKLNALFEDESVEDAEDIEKNYPVYTEDDFLDEVFMSEEEYSRLVGILRAKKNIILQGAPGVGKTFAAKRLAYSIMGVKDIDRVMMVQFHQSYSYEDFIMGFRPSASGFELKKGAFYNFCKKAEIDSDNDYFFIIDEINRGNLSKIFGELFMLIENDKRGVELQLLYSDEKFAVPENVYIIGMMNTADRSLAMLDYALRRRFAFFEIKPGFETDGFREYRMSMDNEKFNKLISCVESLNSAIAADESLGEGFCIGHSYFCNLEADEIDDYCLYGIVEYELIPLLKEYWFDEPTKVKDWSNNLRSAVK